VCRLRTAIQYIVAAELPSSSTVVPTQQLVIVSKHLLWMTTSALKDEAPPVNRRMGVPGSRACRSPGIQILLNAELRPALPSGCLDVLFCAVLCFAGVLLCARTHRPVQHPGEPMQSRYRQYTCLVRPLQSAASKIIVIAKETPFPHGWRGVSALWRTEVSCSKRALEPPTRGRGGLGVYWAVSAL
jgi:hypothetical protein